MPRTIRFHLDETCNQRLASGLRLHGVDVTTTQDAGLSGATDEEQLEHAHSEGRTIFTHDSDFVGLHKAADEHSGIIYCHQHRYTLGEMIRRLTLYWEIYEPEELKNQFEYL